MAKTGFKTIDEYIASRPTTVQPTLKKLRGIVRKALPKAEEAISYHIPAYRLHGRIVVFFAGWSEHYSLYPAGSRLSEALKKDLAAYEMSRGTIRFPLSKPIPETLITRIVKFRAGEVQAKATASSKTTKAKTSSRQAKRKRSSARKRAIAVV
jgi:uncharacterized protein YdhG (YjbR/CyaY superfamily)